MASSPDRRNKTPLIVCAGIVVIDYVYRLEHFPAPGTKTRARDFIATGGGCAANAAVAIARLGARARLAAPLGGPAGKDAGGEHILTLLGAEDVDCSGVVRVDGVSSPISSILVDRSGERLIVNYRDDRLSTARAPDPDALVASADAVLIDNRLAEFALPVAQAARRKGLIVVLDGDQPTRLTDALLSVPTHIVFSAAGLRATAGHNELAAALGEIGARTPSFVAVTDGAHGMLWRDEAGAIRTMPAFAVKAADTLAAGDVFHGAFALALAEGRDIAAALRFSAAAAAIKCTRFGGIAGSPTRQEVEQFLSQA